MRIGERVATGNGKERPARLDYFRFLPEDENLLARFAALYGARPRRLRVCFLHDDLEQVFPQYLRCYAGEHLLCKGDGDYARRTLPKLEAEDVRCPGPWDCDFSMRRGRDGKPACKAVGSLFVALPDMGTLTAFQLDTASTESIVRINTGLELLRRVAGTLALVRVDLVLMPAQTRTAAGQVVDFWAIDLEIPTKPVRLNLGPVEGVEHALEAAVDPEALEDGDPGEAGGHEVEPDAADADTEEAAPVEDGPPGDVGGLEDGERVDGETGEIVPGSLKDDPEILAAFAAAGVSDYRREAMLRSAELGGWPKRQVLMLIRERSGSASRG